jgi:hypothetical protein
MPRLYTPTQRSTGFFKYAASNITADDSVLVTTITETAPAKGRLIPFRGWRSLTLYPFGGNAADEDFLIKVLCVFHIGTYSSHMPGYGDFSTAHDSQWIYQLYTTLTCTLGATADGTAGAYLDNTDFTCDTLTASNDAYATAIEAAVGATSGAYSPTGDAIGAQWFAPDLFSPDFVFLGFDLDGGGTTANDVNCLVKLDV